MLGGDYIQEIKIWIALYQKVFFTWLYYDSFMTISLHFLVFLRSSILVIILQKEIVIYYKMTIFYP